MTPQIKNWVIAGGVVVALGGLFWWSNSAVYKTATQDKSSQYISLGQTVSGIPCDSNEMLVYHIHSHLTILVNGIDQTVPHGIGIGRPWVLNGNFVQSGTCFMWLHTHDTTGVIHIEAPGNQIFTLGQFFDVWGKTLTATSVLDATGPVTAYVDGKLFTGDPRTITLANHESIVLESGAAAPVPANFDFAANNL